MTESERVQPTEEDGKIALREHAKMRAMEARHKYGEIGEEEILNILKDPAIVRFPNPACDCESINKQTTPFCVNDRCYLII